MHRTTNNTAGSSRNDIYSTPGGRLYLDHYSFSKGLPDRIYLIQGSQVTPIGIDLVDASRLVSHPLPNAVKLGQYSLRLSSVNGAEDIVTQVHVRDDLSYIDALSPLYEEPYTIVILSNRYISTSQGVIDDEIFYNLSMFNSILGGCFRSFLFEAEPILRDLASARSLRIAVSTMRTPPNFPFVQGIRPNIAAPMRTNMLSHVHRLGIRHPDVVFTLHGSLNYTRASARYSLDSFQHQTTNFTYDGNSYRIGAFTREAGVATLGYYAFDHSHTPLHEFGHAASEENNGRLTDLYHDKSNSALEVNKKSARRRPIHFCDYDGANFNTDLDRDSIGYEASWKSYHPELIAPDLPNLMDNYWLAKGDPRNCRLDKLSSAWLQKRLEFKSRRGRLES